MREYAYAPQVKNESSIESESSLLRRILDQIVTQYETNLIVN